MHGLGWLEHVARVEDMSNSDKICQEAWRDETNRLSYGTD
jgi:hypothetical protein